MTDTALGCLVGLFVGDAAGATLEFFKGGIDDKIALHAMSMPGGGALSVAAGQVTDDSELAMALLDALSKCDCTTLDEDIQKLTALNYIEWHRSRPFDIGQTCMRAFGFANDADSMLVNASKFNMFSEANGALMRIAPLAIWGRNMSVDRLMTLARRDAMLSHPNPVCQDANALYCVTLTHLLTHPFDRHGALSKVQKCLPDVDIKLQQWFAISQTMTNPLTEYNCRVNIGHVKHAFILAFHFLKEGTSYEEAVKRTLMMGGDTDTNAAIVGAVIGALHGFQGIPPYMREPVLKFDCSKHDAELCHNFLGYNRPAQYHVLTAIGKMKSL